MSANPDPDGAQAEEERGNDRVADVDARGAFGVQIGHYGIQINYYGDQTWAGQPARPLLAGSPYRGLSAFEADDAELFFGRDEATKQVLERMSRCADGTGLLVVSGVSGAGKSSLLRAGVLARLRRDGLAAVPGSASWPCLLFTPGRAPLDELAAQVASLAKTDAGAVRQGLAANPRNFALTARQAVLARHEGPVGSAAGRLLLLVDQFEQLFTVCPDEDQRRAFITALHAAATAAKGSGEAPAAMVVLGVRADFEVRCSDYPELAAAIQGRYLLTAMTPRQLRLAITGPATRAGLDVDVHLVQVLLDEISTRDPAASAGPGRTAGAGVLPLLSHALDQAWRTRAGDVLTLADYERTGGIETAVARSAQEAYDQLIPAHQALARQVFLQLATVTPDGTDTAVPAATASLTAGVPATQEGDIDAVLEAFAARRLLTLAAGTVEITHEVLLTAWPLLRDNWLAETRADRIIRSGLRSAATNWDRHGRDPAYLYAGSLLETATAASDRAAADPVRHAPLDADEQDFLAESSRARRRFARVKRVVTVALALLLVALALSTALAISQRDQAVSSTHLADSDGLAAQSQVTGTSDPALARLEAVAAWHLDHTPRAEYAMLKAAILPAATILDHGNHSVSDVAFTPDGKTLAVGTDLGTQLWDIATRRLVTTLFANRGNVAYAVAFSPDGKTLAVGTDHGTHLWDMATRRLMATLPAGGDKLVQSVAFSPDGKTLATDDVGTTELWDVATRRLVASLPVENGVQVDSLMFSPSGTTLAVGMYEGTVQLWDVATRQLMVTLSVASGKQVGTVAFSPDGKTLAISVDDGTVQLRNAATRRLEAKLTVGKDVGISMTFSPDGKTLATGTTSSTAQLWDVATRRRVAAFPVGHGGQVGVAVAFSPDGRTLAAGADDGTTQLLDIATESMISDPFASLPIVARAQVWSVAFSPDGAILAVGTNSGTQLWDVATRQLVGTLRASVSDAISSVAFSPDGATLAAGINDGGAIQLWDVATRRLEATLPAGTGNDVGLVAFSPDGKTLADAPLDGTIQLWKVATRKLVATLPVNSSEGLASMAFSPDGTTLAVGGFGDILQLWDITTHRRSAALHPIGVGEGDVIDSAAFSPDGKTLAIGVSNGVTQLWDTATRKIVTTITLTGPLSSVMFSPDPRILAIHTVGGIQLWDVATGQEVGAIPAGATTATKGETLTIDIAANTLMAFSRSGMLAAVAISLGQVELWRVPYLTNTTSVICAAAGHSFPPATWTQYAPGVPYQRTCP